MHSERKTFKCAYLIITILTTSLYYGCTDSERQERIHNEIDSLSYVNEHLINKMDFYSYRIARLSIQSSLSAKDSIEIYDELYFYANEEYGMNKQKIKELKESLSK